MLNSQDADEGGDGEPHIEGELKNYVSINGVVVE